MKLCSDVRLCESQVKKSHSQINSTTVLGCLQSRMMKVMYVKM
jgi:hypothetical protein